MKTLVLFFLLFGFDYPRSTLIHHQSALAFVSGEVGVVHSELKWNNHDVTRKDEEKRRFSDGYHRSRRNLHNIDNNSSNTSTKKARNVKKWQQRNITWSLENSNNDVITDRDVRNMLHEAFNKWEAVTNLHFIELVNEPPNSAMICIRFEKGKHDDPIAFDGKGGVYAHAWFPDLPPMYPSHLAGDVHFDDAEAFTLHTHEVHDKVQLAWVALHEIGHSLGLKHSDKKGAVMYPTYQQVEDGKIELSYDDVRSIQDIYGKREGIDTEHAHKHLSTRIPHHHSDGECAKTIKAAFIGNDDKLRVFNENGMYTLHEQSQSAGIESGPIPVSTYFEGLEGVTRIDSVFRRPDDKSLVLFHGETFSVYYDKILLDYPRKITNGFQNTDLHLRDIDAAFIWPKTNQLYIFKGGLYWRYSQLRNSDYIADFGYPRNISTNWKGVPNDVDSVFTWTNGKMYFTKGEYYYRWDNMKRQVHAGYPVKLARSFLNCHAALS